MSENQFDRRSFLRKSLIPAGTLCLSSVLPAQVLAQSKAAAPQATSSPLSQRLQSITRATAWQPAGQVKVQFKTFHPQGMVKIGDDFWVSSVEVQRPAAGETFDWRKGKGHLFRMDASGHLLADIPIGEGTMYHPSGIDFDGSHIWIAAAEYRPDSQSIIYRFDVASMQLQEVFRWQDHIGGILRNPHTNALHAISWGSRRFYQWQLDAKGIPELPAPPHRNAAIVNPSHYIDYQDNQYLGGNEILFTGLAAFKKQDSTPVIIGGFDIVNATTHLPVHQVPLNIWSPATGAVISQNPSFFELAEEKVRAYFMPDDNDSTIYIFEA
ncbi:hypothetical protein SAMN05421788_10583 [Filimonas lacunae]|uniref:Uncharacterized protein n=1 Tax=Filimonas lacunae TaxID=477680 RepID=A0A1N7QDM3_9BACT|nr:DUF6454 family protein [Filimonas lacunae]SIT20965.1 hypothetical protein SAMN05421788_10583 [Filimonas lacunae]